MRFRGWHIRTHKHADAIAMKRISKRENKKPQPQEKRESIYH